MVEVYSVPLPYRYKTVMVYESWDSLNILPLPCSYSTTSSLRTVPVHLSRIDIADYTKMGPTPPPPSFRKLDEGTTDTLW